MNSTYVIKPEQGKVFKRTEAQEVSYATAINLAAASAQEADSLVAAQWEQVVMDEYRQWQQAQEALLLEQMPAEVEQEYSGDPQHEHMAAQGELEPALQAEAETEAEAEPDVKPETEPAEVVN